MFGRPMNNFEDFRIEQKLSSLDNRIKEIKNLVEGEQAQAIDNIKKKQTIQIR